MGWKKTKKLNTARKETNKEKDKKFPKKAGREERWRSPPH